jgi:hypothetical protein
MGGTQALEGDIPRAVRAGSTGSAPLFLILLAADSLISSRCLMAFSRSLRASSSVMG